MYSLSSITSRVASRIGSRSTRPCFFLRTHMNHGGTFMGAPPSRHGPRQPLQLGLDVAKASQNVLRLLESSHGIQNYGSQFQDASSPCWHNTAGIQWTLAGNEWKARRPNSPQEEEDHHHHDHHGHDHDHRHHHHHHDHNMDWIPTISWLQFSDDRTALAKLQAMDASQRYISLLRLDQDPSSNTMIANDRWVIVREVVANTTNPATTSATVADWTAILKLLQDYFDIEHGGGSKEYQKAKDVIFHPQASLLTVGMDRPDKTPSDWSAPVGTLLEISLETYLEGVSSQTPHSAASRRHDAIVQVDISGAAAAATVKVGNGAQTLVFTDHLLLGRGRKDDSGWKILSKTFSPQLWEDEE